MAVFLTTKMFFEYRGAIFWKMAAGMGDVVFAPLYQALRRRGVGFEFFHRVDALHVSATARAIEAVTLGRQAHLAPGRRDATSRSSAFGGLPGFPARPLVDQLDAAPGHRRPRRSSRTSASWPDAETRVLRRGEDFDVVVFAIPVGMAPIVCGELHRRPARVARAWSSTWRTTATQAVQLWLREDEPALGWHEPGATVSAYEAPFNTWASMPQLIDVERWPGDDRPRIDRLLLRRAGGALAARRAARARTSPEHRARVRANAVELVERRLAHLLPGVGGGRVVPLGRCSAVATGTPVATRSTPSCTSPTSTPPTATCSAPREATSTGCAPTRAATTTSSSPATGPTTG